MALTPLLEELRLAFLERGCDVDRHLRPGLPPDEIRARISGSGVEAPSALVELYAWRDGQSETAQASHDAFCFRDCPFLDLERALGELELVRRLYPPAPDALPLGFELDRVVPFASLMGSTLAVVCGAHTLPSPDPHPVVNLFQGIEVFFHSLESMTRTCIDWVRDPRWSPATHLPGDVEHRAWVLHNPGLFEARD